MRKQVAPSRTKFSSQGTVSNDQDREKKKSRSSVEERKEETKSQVGQEAKSVQNTKTPLKSATVRQKSSDMKQSKPTPPPLPPKTQNLMENSPPKKEIPKEKRNKDLRIKTSRAELTKNLKNDLWALV